MQRRLAILGVLLLAGGGLLAQAATTLNVQVREGRLYAKPSFLSPTLATLPYGSAVSSEGGEGPWLGVRTQAGQAGFMHLSALTEKTVVLSPGTGGVQTGASGEEMALAGKGFSKEVENSYRQSHQGLNYAWVDQMEGFAPDAPELAAFLAAGGLSAGGAQ